MSNTEYLRSLHAALDGLLSDLDANGSPESAAASLRYHLKEHGLAIRPSVTEPETPAAPRTEAGRRLVAMLPDYGAGAKTNRWQEHLQRYVDVILAIEAEAAALAARPALDVERIRARAEEIDAEFRDDDDENGYGAAVAHIALALAQAEAAAAAARLAPQEPTPEEPR